MDVNSALSLLGSIGWYQTYVYLLSCVPVINAGIVMLSLVFLSATPHHRCFVPNCDPNGLNANFFDTFLSQSIPKVFGSVVSYESCNRFKQINDSIIRSDAKDVCDINRFTNQTESCDHFVFDRKQFQSTVVTEYPLQQYSQVEDKPSGKATKFFIHVLTNSYGRRSVFMAAPILGFSSAVLSSFAPNFLIFCSSSAVTAACIAGMYQTAFIIGIEFIGGQWRVWCGNIHSILFAVGAAVLCLMAYYVRDWRQLQFVIALPVAFTLSYPWLFPESVRWQVSNGQTSKAIKTIKRAAKWNRVYIPEEYLYTSEDVSDYLFI
ncbi:unnamed protein product [Oppiella nova]|uniref:Uncharacterized protein n=1 Tax=Oppiella nova TaxID=334625 RepID=A0A7R9QKM3_9ACAR|nr:unnamed protein product [Oppiella nova]CAG2167848.1 unnamed protein product [Oppiella nova]